MLLLKLFTDVSENLFAILIIPNSDEWRFMASANAPGSRKVIITI